MTRSNPLIRLRARAAGALVRWASRGWEASYQAHVRWHRCEVGRSYPDFWHALARCIDGFAIPLASRLNREAAGRQMVEECWWG